MIKFGIMSCNIYCNFTNYGSALQSWALKEAVNKIGENRYEAILVDYCPKVMEGKDPLNPLSYMWDSDPVSKKMCELSLPAIKENYYKFKSFYNNEFKKSIGIYDAKNFNEIKIKDGISSFICGSDTIFCVDEFGFDDGYYANFDCMKNGYSFSYAASFGDTHFNADIYNELKEKLNNFKLLSIRENAMIPFIKENTNVPVRKVIDPTLLLNVEEYEKIIAPRQEEKKYILYYARRYNPKMEEFAEKMAKKNNWEIIEISLRATNSRKHRMFYEAGVEEFLSLIKYAECVITNSFHGMIFSVQFRKDFYAFSRDQCDGKINELLQLFDLEDRLFVTGEEAIPRKIDYTHVHDRINEARKDSIAYLENALNGCDQNGD